MKGLLLIMDGLGDIGKTPLEAAQKENMDEMAKEGSLGFFISVGAGIPSGSDVAHLYLLGYTLEDYPGRGPLEALGRGINLREGEIAFRANLATIKDGVVVDRRVGRIPTELNREITKAISHITIDGVEFEYKTTMEHRGVVIMRGKGLSDKISDVDPHKTGVSIKKAKALDGSEEAKRTAELVNKYVEEVAQRLKDVDINKEREAKGKLPGNAILLRGAGMYRKVKPFEEKFGVKAACIAGGALYKGVAKYLGFDVIEVEGATGDKHTNLKAKAEAALRAKETHDIVFLHVKATDSFSHDGDWEGKKWMIERVDKEIVSRVKDKFDAIIITGDHSTPCSYKEHSGHYVPLLAYGKNVRKDETKAFSEKEAMKGGLGVLRGNDVMHMLINYIEKAKLVGS